MLRHLYRCTLRLHPSSFRKRFASEMLSIYDQAQDELATLRLLVDGIVSLARQWALRPQFWREITPALAQTTSDGVPSFSTLDSFHPRPAALIHGMVLSITLFCLTCTAIRYSWIRVLNIRVPEVEFESYLPGHPSANPAAFQTTRAQATPAASPLIPPPKLEGMSAHLQVDVLPVEAQQIPAPSGKKANTDTVRDVPVRPLAVPVVIVLDLEHYVGTYNSSSPKVTISIQIEDEHLTMEIAGQPKRRLSPVSETTFSVNEVKESWVEFVPDSNGRIGRLQLLYRGQHLTAERR